ncbi:hypothetical protein FLA_0051 [Filimonas lacunae]|nr:hypothetical protein FLA_0051 [Filimonas lacunae]
MSVLKTCKEAGATLKLLNDKREKRIAEKRIALFFIVLRVIG